MARGISVLKKAVDLVVRIRAALVLTATQSLNATVTPVVLIPIVAEPTPRIIASGRHTIYWSTPTSPYRSMPTLHNLAFQTATAMAAKSTARVQLVIPLEMLVTKKVVLILRSVKVVGKLKRESVTLAVTTTQKASVTVKTATIGVALEKQAVMHHPEYTILYVSPTVTAVAALATPTPTKQTTDVNQSLKRKFFVKLMVAKNCAKLQVLALHLAVMTALAALTMMVQMVSVTTLPNF